MTKQIGGRKSDVLDCQWIWQLISYGLLRGAFRPGDAVCPLRSYARQMRRLPEDPSASLMPDHPAPFLATVQCSLLRFHCHAVSTGRRYVADNRVPLSD